jgi:hypothetical protein
MELRPYLLKHLCILGLSALTLAGCGGAPAGSSGTLGDGTSTTGTASIKIGNSGGSSFVSGTAASVSLPSASTTSASWTINVNVVDADNLAVTDEYVVTFSSSCATEGLASFLDPDTVSQVESVTATTVAGRASAAYSSEGCTGIDTVVASTTANDVLIRAVVDLDIDEALSNDNDSSDDVLTVISIGNGLGANFVGGVLAASTTELQAGGSTFISVNVVDQDGDAYTSTINVVFSSNCTNAGLASFSQNTGGGVTGEASVQLNGGLATNTYTANGCSGDDTITASVQRLNSSGSITATIPITIALDTVLGVEFVSISESVLAIAGIGGVETAAVIFRVVGAQGAPIVGESVSFELTNSSGGARLAEGSETGITDFEGNVRTVVQSGTVNSSTRIIATHDASTFQGFSEDITISTGVPVRRGFDLSYGPFNPRAASINNVEVDITVNASDQFGNPPPDGSRVSFRSVEVGIVDPSCELVNGECTVIWSSSGDRNLITPDESGRGYRATVIGFMSGAEDFNDFNSNGLFDSSNSDEVASVIHLGEAFTDENENGVYDFGEDFVDSFLNFPAPTATVEGGFNGSYDTSSDPTYSIYNGPCSELINTDCEESELQSTVIWDSIVIALSSDNAGFCSLGNLPAIGGPITVPLTISGVLLCDENGNSLPVGTKISFSLDANNVELQGNSDFDVSGDTTEPAGPLGVTIAKNGIAAATGLFLITVEVPDVNVQEFAWSLTE